MKRTLLVAAVSIAPILLTAQAALATDTISSSTSAAVATATATNNAPDNIDIASGGSIGMTAPGVAVTLNSSNVVTVEGAIGFTDINSSVGVEVIGGNTGSVTNTGAITLTESYTAPTDNNTGLLTGAFAQGFGRVGIELVGPGTFTGSITNAGTITVHGESNSSGLTAGVSIQGAMTGDYQSVQVTPATSTAVATVVYGSISMMGDAAAGLPNVGFQVTKTGSVGGNVVLGNVTASGLGAQAVDIEGAVGGTINLGGAISATGYRATSRSSYPTIAAQYTAQEMEQGGAAVTIGANVGGGLILSAPPLTAITNVSTTIDVVGNQQVPQDQQGTGSIISYGSAPALVIGSATAGQSVTLGLVGASDTVLTASGVSAANTYGLVNQGSITGNGLFDQITTPNLPAPVSATALQVGNGGGAATIQGGVYNSGAIGAVAYQASATAIHFLNGGATPLIVNDGMIVANSIQQTTSTTGQTPANVYGILIDAGSSVQSIVNNSGILANISGTSGVGGTAGAIIDHSGSVTSIVNTGTIYAQATQTLLSAPMPVVLTAIDISASNLAQSITQSANAALASTTAYNATLTYTQGAIASYQGVVYQATTAVPVSADPLDYPSEWREIGALSPVIQGSILFGSGGGSLTVNAGFVTAPILNLGTGSNNAITVNGAAGSSASATVVTGAVEEVSSAVAAAQVSGANTTLQAGGNGTMTVSVNNGTLSDTNPNVEFVKSVSVGSNGVLLVSADPIKGVNTDFVTTGASTFGAGATIGLTLLSVPKSLVSTFTILQTVPGQGTLSASTFNSGVASAPWLYNAVATYVPSSNPATTPSEIQLTVTQKTASQVGFNAAEAAALDAILAAAPNNSGVQAALLSQTTAAGLKSIYDQLMPNQGQGMFDALNAAAQAVSSMTSTTPPASSRVAGTSLWVQEVNDRVDRSGEQTNGSFTKLVGIVGGYEHSGALGGAAGLTMAYFNTNELDHDAQLGSGVVASTVEAGAYYRRSLGGLTVSARGAIGYSWYADSRVFVATTTINNSTTGTELRAHSNWGGLYYLGHFQAAYEQSIIGRYYLRPELSVDYFNLNEGAHSDTGGGNAFDLNVAARDSNRMSGQALLVLGRQWGSDQGAWLRGELRGGYRDIFSGQVGDTVASFSGGNPFTLAPDSSTGGWFTAGFSIKTGSQYSYLALEGDVDFRAGEQMYDIRIAGRSVF